MSEPAAASKRPTGVAITAALTPFMGGPVAFALFTIALGSGGGGDGGLFGRLANAWAEGGVFMYVVLLVGGLVAMTSAALMFFGVQRGSPAVLACAPLGALVTAVGAVGFFNGISGAADAVVHASPADRATIMAAATAESLTTSAFGMAGTAGLLASLALGCLFGVVAQTGLARKLLVFSGATFLSLSFVSTTALMRLSELMGLFKAVANVSPLDRPTILVMGSDELARFRLPMLGFIVLVLVVLVAGALAMKESPRTAVLLVLLGAGGLVGLGVQAGLTSLSEGKAAGLLPVDPSLALIELDGFAASPTWWCLSGAEVRDCVEGRVMGDEQLADELAAHVRNKAEYGAAELVSIPVGVAPKASAAALWKFIDAAVRAKANGITLTGQKDTGSLKVVAELAALAPLMQVKERSVPVGFATEGTPCEGGCELGTVVGDTVKGEQLVFDDVRIIDERAPLRDVVHVKADRTVTPERLARLAIATANEGRTLVLVLPAAAAAE